ncbi:hypothetical protein BDA99DRAFT_531473 [Phascolomyces articulosus]|uniref:Uncharacterized protein n=1 Tax=Phascolomyces articulosus TaxID=60185 RepID=A0AAD5PK13_9FUNG|nr:hypothetical protein BDA99DRAFT_531473 [Phascolomyces articulosus]
MGTQKEFIATCLGTRITKNISLCTGLKFYVLDALDPSHGVICFLHPSPSSSSSLPPPLPLSQQQQQFDAMDTTESSVPGVSEDLSQQALDRFVGSFEELKIQVEKTKEKRRVPVSVLNQHATNIGFQCGYVNEEKADSIRNFALFLYQPIKVEIVRRKIQFFEFHSLSRL